MLPQEFIDKLKDVISLKKLVEDYTELKKCGPFLYMGHCPHPDHNDSSPSFRVFEKGYRNGGKENKYDTWACMGCHSGKKINTKNNKNYGSDCIAFIMFVENLNWREAVKFLSNKYHIPMPTEENTRFFKFNLALADSLLLNTLKENSRAIEYLKNRHLDIQDIKKWKIGFDGTKVTFPLFDKYKNVLGFTRRYLKVPEGANDKYKNSYNNKFFSKRSYFYGIHNLDENFDEIRITEGSMDVILADKYKVKNIVATLGTSFTEEHINIIKHYNKTPVLIFDGDQAGIDSMEKTMILLAKENIYCKILILPNNKDLYDIAIEKQYDLEDYIKNNAITYGSYLLKSTISDYQSKLLDLNISYIPELKQILDKIPSDDELIALKSYIKNSLNIDL